jgi:hypothetical protein
LIRARLKFISRTLESDERLVLDVIGKAELLVLKEDPYQFAGRFADVFVDDLARIIEQWAIARLHERAALRINTTVVRILKESQEIWISCGQRAFC